MDNLGNDNNGSNNVSELSQHKKAHIPCPNCSNRLYVDNPEIELFNTLNISQLIASHSTVRCNKCDKEWVPAILPNAQITWGLIPVERPKEDNLIVIPSIDASKLKLN